LKNAADMRHDDQEDHRDAVHREDLVVDLLGQQVLFGLGELRTDQPGLRATEREEHQRGEEVHHADALVVGRAEPAEQSRLRSRAAGPWCPRMCSS
jgi:hypothetical protein